MTLSFGFADAGLRPVRVLTGFRLLSLAMCTNGIRGCSSIQVGVRKGMERLCKDIARLCNVVKMIN